MMETILGVIAFVLFIPLSVIEIVNARQITRLKQTISEMYLTVAEDRSNIYKLLETVKEDFSITEAEMLLLAGRLNTLEGCDKCEGKCTDECKKDTIPVKQKRPRKPRQ